MAKVNLSWPANPPEEMVSGYNIFMDGAQVGTSTGPAFTIDPVQPGVHDIAVQPVGQWGAGPMSDDAHTPPQASKIPSLTFTIVVA